MTVYTGPFAKQIKAAGRPDNVRKPLLPNCLLALALVSPVLAAPAVASTTELSFGGFIKLDAVTTHTTDGKLPAGSVGREFYIPGLTPHWRRK